MLKQAEMTRKFGNVFNQRQAVVLAEVVTEAYSDLVKTGDFNELKSIMKELAVAQTRTESRVEELAVAQTRTESRVEELAVAQTRTESRVEELAVAQTRTDSRVEELAVAQTRTDSRVEELAVAQTRTEQRVEELVEAQKETQYEIQTLTKRLGDLGSTVGGLGNSMGYALENEAYRMLPSLLKEKYGLEMTERFVRTYIDGVEINLFGKAKRNGQELLIVGETKSRLDERRNKQSKRQKDIWEQLSERVATVQQAHPGVEIAPLIITHHARPGALKQAEKKGVIVVQSFEW
ncbi:MAG TPA: hypothetical protein G4N96_12635 [Chloroflexi bacterium]|nr:hypothetical protein [Chloroflexota bacterium]